MGQMTASLSPWKIVQTPSGSVILSLVQLGTLLLYGHRRFVLYLAACPVLLSGGKPKSSAMGCRAKDSYPPGNRFHERAILPRNLGSSRKSTKLICGLHPLGGRIT